MTQHSSPNDSSPTVHGYVLRVRTIAWYCAVEFYSVEPLAATKIACVGNSFAAASAAPRVSTPLPSLFDVSDAHLCCWFPQAKTINPGAYFRFLLTGQNVTLHADTSAMCAMGSQIWTRVDAGPLVQHVLGAPSWDSAINVPLGPPFSASPTHLVRVFPGTPPRWPSFSIAVDLYRSPLLRSY